MLLILLMLTSLNTLAASRKGTRSTALRDSVLRLVYSYAETVDTTGMYQETSYLYTKFQLRTVKRNATLLLVPTMYAMAKSNGRNFFGEYYHKVERHPDADTQYRRLLNVSTLPRRRTTLPTLLQMLQPDIYGESLFRGNILSPFHRKNHRYYTFRVVPLPFGKAQLYVFPKLRNTQTVAAKAIVDTQTGKIYSVDVDGEYDMTRFYISITMGSEDYHTLLPKRCTMRANFKLLGNHITGFYTSFYDLPKVISDSLENVTDTTLMAKVRPEPLSLPERQALQQYYQQKELRDSLSRGKQQEKNFAKDVLWDVIGDNVLNRISQGFGKEKQGYIRISPILNPLYMGYSHRKGFVYKFDIRAAYTFSPSLQLSLRLKAGYSFKQHQFYYQLPLTFKYSQRHDGYLKIELGNGNRINTDMVARHMLGYQEKRDTLPLLPQVKPEDFTDFKDNYIRLTNHWNFNDRWGFEVGLVGHHRVAVNPDFYTANDYPASYRSLAPALALEYRPQGLKGPIIKLDYEASIKGLYGANIDYQRWELDAQTILRTGQRQAFSLRAGAGFYTAKGDHWYFVDYTNFRDNNIPGGWDDDWSGRFELLSASWYNASPYYVRTNCTYETPMLFAAWAPLAGRFIERERIYVNTLFVDHLHPYTEWGYGFTTRLLSIGAFAAFRNAEFQGVGCRFGFELFRDW